MVAFCDDVDRLGVDFFDMEFVPDRTIASAAMGPVVWSDRPALACDLVDTPADLHRVDWQGCDIAPEAIAHGERSNSVRKAPLWPTKSLTPVAARLLLLQGFVRLWADVRVLLELPVPDDVFGAPAPTDHTPGDT